MSVPGDILHYKDFVFENGTVKNKYFIVLHGDPCLTLITTSQSLRYPMVETLGCHAAKMTFFIPIGQVNIFTKPTYLVMQRIYELPKNKIEKSIASHQIIKKATLPLPLFNSIKKCLGHFREDIADEHWDMIFKPGAPAPSSLQALADKFKRK